MPERAVRAPGSLCADAGTGRAVLSLYASEWLPSAISQVELAELRGAPSLSQHFKVPGAELRLLGLAAAQSPVGSLRPERQYRGDIGCGRPNSFLKEAPVA